MNFDKTIISKLCDADKTTDLFKTIASSTPEAARNALKITPGLTRQLLFVFGGQIGVLSFPHVTTDSVNALRLLGCFGNDANTLVPAACPGDLLNQSFSALVTQAMAVKHLLPVLVADPLNLMLPLLWTRAGALLDSTSSPTSPRTLLSS
jgi:hypothetical protein